MAKQPKQSDNNPFPATARRQTEFLRLLQPLLVAQPWLRALWLLGSPAQGAGDGWSSVDLHLLVANQAAVAQSADYLRRMLDHSFPDDWIEFSAQSEYPDSVEGMTYAPEAAVYFRLLWTEPGDLARQLARHGPIRLLWAAPDLAEEVAVQLTAPVPALRAADAQAVQARLIGFWQVLSRLPGAMNRREALVAVQLLHTARQHLLDLVVALNGATRPAVPARINRFLGPAQQEAFEKSLGTNLGAEGWIGQAVALIVLYHWYAPQLVEIHRLPYPARLEESVLALLSDGIYGWPALITTK